MYQRERSNIYRMWFLLFTVGFLLGIFFVNFQSGVFLGDEGVFSNASINRLKYLNVESGLFFRYVLIERLKNYFFIGLLSVTFFGIVAIYVCIAWQGILLGMIITAAVVRFGMKGILLILAFFFPHQLLLIPASVMMLYWSYQNCCFLYFPGKKLSTSQRYRKRPQFRQMLLLFWIIGVVIIGCVLECYVNPVLLSDMLKIF